jgi:hypothetical protein
MRNQVKHKLKNLLMKTFESLLRERNHAVPASRPFKWRLASIAATALLVVASASTECTAAEVFAGAAP